MRPGQTHVGPDGTIYVVVRPRDVRQDQMRWWVDRAWARSPLGEYIGPDTPSDLHLLPKCDCGDVVFALVLPS